MQNLTQTIMHDDLNPLERALRLAAADAASRPDFYHLLLQSQVFVVGDAEETEDGDRPVQAGEAVSIQQWQTADGTLVVPFFTSIAAAEQVLESDASCLGLPARTLFEKTRGATLILNPNLEHGKQFLPHEVDAMLADGVPSTPTLRPPEEETDFILSEPAQYPTRMVDALITFFAKRSQVKAAYLAHMRYEEPTDKPSRLIIGIHADGDFDHLAKETAAVIADTGPRGERLNLYQITPGGDGFSYYLFENFKPFYESSWGSRLTSLTTQDGGHA